VKTLVRSSLALAALAALAVGAAGCNTVRPAALTVNGHDVSQSSINRELSAIADNPGLRSRISDTDGTIKSGGSAVWLTQLVAQQVVDRELQRHRTSVTAADREAGQAQAEEFFGGPQVFGQFPKWFRDRASERFSRQQALFRVIGTPATDSDVRAAYDATIARLRAQCASGRFVSHILVPTREQADALAAQLASGANFEQLARQQSTDRSSATDGGELGCIDGQQLIEPFAQPASTLPLNQVSAPVQTQFGWHLILVRDTIPFELLEAPLRQRLGQQSPDAERKLGQLVAKAKVDVDPRYGRWVVRAGRGTVEPPRGAPSLNPPTTPTRPAAPTGPPTPGP
jgi:parvulin-like peptidyl-prolyl isomerase